MASVENVRAVQELIESAVEYPKPPDHVAHRIGVLVSDPQNIQFVDAIGGDDRGKVSGELYMFTPTVVVHATWECPEWGDARRSSGVLVETWSRKALRSVDICADPELKGNIDGDWKGTIGKGWPETGRVTLRYADREDVVTLPIVGFRRVKAERILEFLPSLMEDLAK